MSGVWGSTQPQCPERWDLAFSPTSWVPQRPLLTPSAVIVGIKGSLRDGRGSWDCVHPSKSLSRSPHRMGEVCPQSPALGRMEGEGTDESEEEMEGMSGR